MATQMSVENRAIIGRINELEQSANAIASSVEEIQAKTEKDQADLERDIKGVISSRRQIEEDLHSLSKEIKEERQLMFANLKKKKNSGNFVSLFSQKEAH